MILRKALLISAPGGDPQSPGINADLEATKQFLLSPKGGAWKENEILVLNNPTLKTLSRSVKKMVADYTITFFSGNGFPDKEGNHFLLVDGNDFFQDTELLNSSPKQVVIIDGVRELLAEAKRSFSINAAESENARKMYDKWIERCEPGQMIMHATEKAILSPMTAKGGLFTQKLLQIANNITPAKDKFNLKSILAAGHETPDLLLEEGFEEGPAITYSNGNIKLPFAMALPAPPPSLLPVIRKDDLSTGLTLGMFFLAFFLSLE